MIQDFSYHFLLIDETYQFDQRTAVRTQERIHLLYLLDAFPHAKLLKVVAERIPEETILELVKLSDLARIPGLKKVRARLYFDAGLDTLEKIAKYKPDELIKELKVFIKNTGFKGIAPVPKEAKSTIANAQYLRKIADY